MGTVQLADLVMADLQPRAEMCEAVIEDYAIDFQVGAPFPPIVVFREGDTLRLSEGFHRVIAALRVGLTELPAIIKEGGATEAMWHAASSNKTHGLRRTNADKRRAVEFALTAHPEMSDRAIAQHCGVSDPFVGQVRAQVLTVSTCPAQDTRVGKDGKSYPVTDYGPPPEPKPASKPAPPPEPPKPAVVDRIGRPVPDGVLGTWERADEVQADLRAISALRTKLRAAMEEQDPLYAEANLSAITADLNNAYRHLKTALPFAVCPSCQGKVKEGCKLCVGRGLISEHRWRTAVPKETKDLIERSMAS